MVNNILTIISCHTNSDIKINALIHNLKYFMEISDTIAIINSLEFINLNIEEQIKKAFLNKNIIFNDILTDEICYMYKTKYIDLSAFNNEQLREHWVKYGKSEKRTFLLPVYNIYFDYKQNDKFIAHGKWLHILNKINYSNYENIILTNDSFIITRSLLDLKHIVEPTTELIAVVDSYQTKHHYPDFFRIYNNIGINKLIKYYEMNRNNITNFLSIINVYEIESSHIFESVKILYKNNETVSNNIHFDNTYLEDYLYNKNYPFVKIKKIISNFYADRNVPNDFNASEYKQLNADLISFSNNDAYAHFKNHGISEGRLYKKNQQCKMPIFLEHYINLIGFRL